MSFQKIAGAGVIGTAIGMGVAALAPGVLRAARPALLKALSAGIALSREGRVALEGVWEDVEDLVAEARTAADRASEPTPTRQTASNVTPFGRDEPVQPERPPNGA